MTYHLMNAAINKDLGEYEQVAEALNVVRALVNRFGEHHADDLVLATDEEDGIAWTGAELLQHLRDVGTAQELAEAAHGAQRRS
jgi:hypothetical protein